MKSPNESPIVPEQEEGKEDNLKHEVSARNLAEARDLFAKATSRLKNVNGWDKYAGALSGKFTLTDSSGSRVERTPRVGDYFKILMPAPDEQTGDKYDWVRIESIDDQSGKSKNEEMFAITVYPSPSPRDVSDETSHFFDKKSSSTFQVSRKDFLVTASYFGRNKKANTEEPSSIAGKIRNAVVAVGAMLGFSSLQWKALIKGFLESGE